MRAKKWLTIITFAVGALSLILVFVFNCTGIKLAYDICLAMLGSTVLGFVMSLIEYFAERRNAMEYFWQEANKALSRVRKIKYINVSAPIELVTSCFNEEANNKFASENPALKLQMKNEAKDNFVDWLKSNDPLPEPSEDDSSDYYQQIYEHKLAGYRKEFEDGISSCVAVSEIDLETLGNAYGNLDFIFANASIRKDAYNKIFTPISKLRDEARKESLHFNMLGTEDGNFAVCAKKAATLAEKFFEAKEMRVDGVSYKVIYQTPLDDIDEALEVFRCSIYRNQKFEKPERMPVMFIGGISQ